MTRRSGVDFDLLIGLFEDDVVVRRDLIKMGVSSSTIARQCRPGGRWTRLLPGVYLLAGGSPSRRQVVRAALLRAGPLVGVTGLEAVRRLGVRRLPDDERVHILVPEGRGIASRDFLLIERTNRPWRGKLVDGFPVVSAARALIDAARRMERIDVIRAMISDAVQRRIVSPEQLGRELRYIRLAGTHLPRRVVDEIKEGVRSAAEAWSLALIKRSPLPKPQLNVLIRDSNGKQLAIVDGWWDDVGVAWQIDSKEFHTSPEDYARTMAQHSALVAAGVLVVHTLPSRLVNDTRAVVNELIGTHTAGRRRPRPPVSATLFRPI